MTILEVVVAAAIIVTVVTGLSGAWQLYLKISNINSQNTQAALLAEEAEEALNIMRDQSWSANILPLTTTPNQIYYLYWSGNAYAATTTATAADSSGSFMRTIVFKPISRDSTTKDISASGTNDPNTKQVTITVYPTGNASTTLIKADMLIHNVYNN